ncbi:MAG: type II toxin-antitoxin system RelE/ParE family toxin, partial [Deltaproteobacteria bacterium]
MITVAETGEFIRKAKKLLSEEERQELVSYLSAHPESGNVMAGTGGIRKLRWTRQGMGKSGGVRVIFFYFNEGIPLYVLTLFGKGDKGNLTQAERNDLAKLVDIL